MRGDPRKSTLSAIAAAALLAIGGACFGVYFYRNAPRDLTAAEIVRREPQLPQITAEGTSADAASHAESSTDSSQDESSRPDESSDGAKETSAAEESSALQASSEVQVSSAVRQEVSEQPQYDIIDDSSTPVETATALPDAGTPAKTAPSGREADREYFTTSIKDGETVSESTYFFTVTQLDSTLTLVRCDVELNGSVLTGYAGKCHLKEGANSIRVSCTYKDSSSMVLRAFRDYTINLKSKENAIVTDLTDRDVFEPTLTFSAVCEDGLEVYLNGQPVSGSGSYTVTLNTGENVIRLVSGRRGLDFSVTYIPVQGLDIITDLSDCTVYSESLSFNAQTAGGDSPKLIVQLNGKTLRGSEGSFTAKLNEGENTIRLLAKDGGDKVEKSFRVVYLSLEDESRLPKLDEINLTDNMDVKGSFYSLSLKASDMNGERIYSGHIEVACGGAAAERRWEDASSTGYLLKLHQGENSVYIRLTDNVGRQSEFFYNVNCEAAQDNEEVGRIAISVSADVLGLGILCENGSYPVLEGETGFDTVVRFLEDNGFEAAQRGSDSSRYLERISKPGAFAGAALTAEAREYLEGVGLSINDIADPDSLGEFDYTPSSGWLYSRDGKKPSYAMSAAVFADGETVELRFSLDFGNDTGM